MRHAYGNANLKPDGNTYLNAYANSDAYRCSLGYTYSHGYSYRHTVTHANVRTWWYTWAVGYCHARATGSLSRWRNDRWNKHLRVRRW
jgi:hypothetical protein